MQIKKCFIFSPFLQILLHAEKNRYIYRYMVCCIGKFELTIKFVLHVFFSFRTIVTGVLADRHPTKLHLFRTYKPTLQQLEVKGICQREGSKKKRDSKSKDKRQSCNAEDLFCPAPPNGMYIIHLHMTFYYFLSCTCMIHLN